MHSKPSNDHISFFLQSKQLIFKMRIQLETFYYKGHVTKIIPNVVQPRIRNLSC